MQTFLPYSDFKKSVQALDNKRLGNQRVECKQILKALTSGGGWSNHPAVQMWRGYEEALKLYMNECVLEWVARGFKNNMPLNDVGEVIYPPWLDGPIHASHRSNLLRKNPMHYSQFEWEEDPWQTYYWPRSKYLEYYL